MSFLLEPWHILRATLCGLVNHRQQQIIEFQNAPIEALLKKLGKKRVPLDDEQRRLLGVKGHAIGRKALIELHHNGHACGRAQTPQDSKQQSSKPIREYSAGKSQKRL
ncbi:MAG: hypothetical protein ABGZ17_28125 [Planctomycetaceae bacterium]